MKLSPFKKSLKDGSLPFAKLFEDMKLVSLESVPEEDEVPELLKKYKAAVKKLPDEIKMLRKISQASISRTILHNPGLVQQLDQEARVQQRRLKDKAINREEYNNNMNEVLRQTLDQTANRFPTSPIASSPNIVGLPLDG